MCMQGCHEFYLLAIFQQRSEDFYLVLLNLKTLIEAFQALISFNNNMINNHK